MIHSLPGRDIPVAALQARLDRLFASHNLDRAAVSHDPLASGELASRLLDVTTFAHSSSLHLMFDDFPGEELAASDPEDLTCLGVTPPPPLGSTPVLLTCSRFCASQQHFDTANTTRLDDNLYMLHYKSRATPQTQTKVADADSHRLSGWGEFAGASGHPYGCGFALRKAG
jgi:hypothetical protein